MVYTSRYITSGILITLAGAALYEVWLRNWSNLFIVALALVLSMVPYILKRNYDIYTPDLLRVGIVAFMFAALFLGQVNQFYARYEWWDLALHGVAGAGLTLIGFILLVILYKESELRSTPFMTSLFAISFTMSGAVLWEVYEYMVDIFFDLETVMQPNNADTMDDLIAAIVGGLLVCIGGYRYLQYHEDGITARAIKEGKERN